MIILDIVVVKLIRGCGGKNSMDRKKTFYAKITQRIESLKIWITIRYFTLIMVIYKTKFRV